MAIAPTGAIYKSLIFDGEDSRDYGVYITGEAVYNAPERDVEMISIPGRSGAFALDKGRFENIEVTYPAGIVAENEADFAEAISDFRNFLCSKKGYCRLQDEYNTDEYRMAVYRSGLEVTPTQLQSGEFEIIFECKPQRYLTSGDTVVEVSSGDMLDNPTLFEASPLIEASGYGEMSVNGYALKIENEVMGNTELQHSWIGNEVSDSNILTSFYDKIYVSPGIANTNDVITAGMTAKVILQVTNTAEVKSLGTPTNISVKDDGGTVISGVNATVKALNNKAIEITATLPASYEYGDPAQSLKCNVHFTITPTDGTDGTAYGTFECYVGVKFWQTNNDDELWLIADINSVETDAGSIPNAMLHNFTTSRINMIVNDVRVDSTSPAYGSPTFIDCEIGEVYKESGDDRISLNRFVSLGSQLPKLAVGSSEVTFDGTFSEVLIVPRWWRV